MSSVFGEAPLRPLRGRESSQAAKSKVAKQRRNQDERVRQRYLVVQFVRELEREHGPLSVRNAEALVAQAVARGDSRLGGIAPPSKTALHRWLDLARQAETQGALSEHAFAEKDGRGRRPLPLQRFIERKLRQLVFLNQDASLPELYAELTDYADSIRMPRPTQHQVRAAREAIDVRALIAAFHGTRAGVVDAAPKSTVPVSAPHDAWVLDELWLPVWIKAYHPTGRTLVSVKTQACIVVDHFSRVIVGHHVFTPWQDDNGLVGYSGEDIAGVVYGAALESLAPPEVREFAGYLPKVLRLDNHKAHERIRRQFQEHGGTVPRLPRHAPHSRGLVESLVGTMKRLCWDMQGFSGKYVPADRITADPRSQRTAAASTLRRARRLTVIAVEDLPNLERLREMFLEAVERYHHRRHRMLRASPRGVYLEHLQPRKVRSGLDVLLWLEPKRLTVQAAGIEHRNTRFGIHLLDPVPAPGTKMDVRVEPLNRRLFAHLGGTIVPLKPVAEAARETDVAAFVTKRQEEAGRVRDAANELRRRELETVFGQEMAERSDDALGRRLAEIAAAFPQEQLDGAGAGEPARRKRGQPARGDDGARGTKPRPRRGPQRSPVGGPLEAVADVMELPTAFDDGEGSYVFTGFTRSVRPPRGRGVDAPATREGAAGHDEASGLAGNAVIPEQAPPPATDASQPAGARESMPGAGPRRRSADRWPLRRRPVAEPTVTNAAPERPEEGSAPPSRQVGAARQASNGAGRAEPARGRTVVASHPTGRAASAAPAPVAPVAQPPVAAEPPSVGRAQAGPSPTPSPHTPPSGTSNSDAPADPLFGVHRSFRRARAG